MCPGVVIHPAIRPGAQSFDRHEIGKYDLPLHAGETRLQDITVVQEVALGARNRPFSGCYLKVTAPLRVEQATKDCWAVEVRQASPSLPTRLVILVLSSAVTNDSVRVYRLISAIEYVFPNHFNTSLFAIDLQLP